jgi:hypothetical protein
MPFMSFGISKATARWYYHRTCAGHVTHMPAHLFLRVGRYAAGVATSQASVANNRRYSDQCLTPYAVGTIAY